MTDKQTFKERLLIFIGYLNMSNMKFEQSCGFSNGTITHLRKMFSVDKLNRIKSVYPQLNMDWLCYGEGDMILSIVCEEVKPYTPSEPSTPYGSMFDELKVLRQKMEIYEGKIDNYEQERTRMLDTITQLTSIISRLTEEREKLANKNK